MPSLAATRIYTRRAFAAPGAGLEFSIVVPNNEKWLLCGLTIPFTTSAAAGTRSVSIGIDVGSPFFHWHFGGNGNVPAVSTIEIDYDSGIASSSNINSPPFSISIPSPDNIGVLAAGYRIRSFTRGLDVADVYGIQTVMFYLLT